MKLVLMSGIALVVIGYLVQQFLARKSWDATPQPFLRPSQMPFASGDREIRDALALASHTADAMDRIAQVRMIRTPEQAHEIADSMLAPVIPLQRRGEVR